MADFDCIKPCIVCPAPPPGGTGLGLSPNDPNNPFNNLSSEAPDVDLFIGRRFTPPGLGNPPLGSTWFSIGCLGFAFSSVSQQDADLIAQQQAVLCTSTEWPLVVTPNPNPNLPPEVTPRPVFFSAPASCDFTCPDGSIFTYSVPAGFFFAFSQVAANAMAESFACNRVVANRSCFGPAPTSRTCLDSAYASFIAVASANLPITFTIQSGSLPPGISAAQSPDTYFLSGTPTLPGDYTFLLRATDSTGGFIEKQISISVFGIINTSPLAEATVGAAYSETLAYAGTSVGTVVFAVISGALPDGLTLNSSTGEISGTPTMEQEASFVVRISDDTIDCSKAFEMSVAGAACAMAGVLEASIVPPRDPDFTVYAPNVDLIFGGGSFAASTMDVISPITLTIVGTVNFPANNFPDCAVYHPTNGKLYVACNNNLLTTDIYEVDTTLLTAVMVASLGDVQVTKAMASDTINNRIYINSNFVNSSFVNGKLSAMALPGYGVSQVSGASNGQGMCYVPTSNLIVAMTDIANAIIYDADTLAQIGSITMADVSDAACRPSDGKVWISTFTGGVVQPVQFGTANTTTTAPFNAPAIGGNVSVPLASTFGFLSGRPLTINGIAWTLVSIDSPTDITAQNLSVAPATVIGAGAAVVCGGFTVGAAFATGGVPTFITWSDEFSKVYCKVSTGSFVQIDPDADAVDFTVAGLGSGTAPTAIGTSSNCKLFMPISGIGANLPFYRVII